MALGSPIAAADDQTPGSGGPRGVVGVLSHQVLDAAVQRGSGRRRADGADRRPSGDGDWRRPRVVPRHANRVASGSVRADDVRALALQQPGLAGEPPQQLAAHHGQVEARGRPGAGAGRDDGRVPSVQPGDHSPAGDHGRRAPARARRRDRARARGSGIAGNGRGAIAALHPDGTREPRAAHRLRERGESAGRAGGTPPSRHRHLDRLGASRARLWSQHLVESLAPRDGRVRARCRFSPAGCGACSCS